ncbi:hypothetical protein JCM3774_004125 [Rhodotorula dairenensis]
MPPLLGASTRHYKAYGKRNTNVVNRTASLTSRKEPAWAVESDSSQDDDDRDDRECAVTAARRSRVNQTQLKAVSAAGPGGKSAARPRKSARPSPAAAAVGQEDAKENAGASTGRTRDTDKKKHVVVVQKSRATSVPPSRRRAPLGPKGGAADKVAPHPVCSKTPELSTDSSSSDPVVVGPPKRNLARNYKRVVVVEEEEESSDSSFATPPGSPSPVVSDLSFELAAAEHDSSARLEIADDQGRARFEDDSLIAQSSRSATDTAAAVADTDKNHSEGRTEEEDDEEGFAVRRRSRRSTAAKTSSSSRHSSGSTPRRLPSPTAHPVAPQLSSLLPHLLSPTVYNFTSFVSAPPSPLASVSTAARTAAAWWTKVGEASYSEVFATAAERNRDHTHENLSLRSAAADEVVVVKVIPIADPRNEAPASGAPTDDDNDDDDDDDEGLPFLSDWSAVEREIVTSRALGGPDGAVPGFVRFRGAFLVQGSYPEELLASWDDYKEKQSPPSDEQIRPHVFASTQLYALILLENAGTDLEAYKLKTWKEAASVFAQATVALGAAERARGFEHRDLHWGNLLLQPTSSQGRSARSRSSANESGDDAARAMQSLNLVSSAAVPLSPLTSGITATLIDFTLSRCRVDVDHHNDGSVFDPFEDDGIFQGTGDEQFDVYRRMREVVEAEGGGWGAAHLRTNVLWLHYLARKLLFAKRLKPPLAAITALIGVSPPDSPRAVPSPRKLTFARRHTLAAAGSAAGSFSPPPPPSGTYRRPRTQPSSMLPGGRKAVLLERESEVERRAYLWLQDVTDALDRLVEHEWRLDGRVGKRPKAAAKASLTAAKTKQRGPGIDISGVTCASTLAAALFGDGART